MSDEEISKESVLQRFVEINTMLTNLSLRFRHFDKNPQVTLATWLYFSSGTFFRFFSLNSSLSCFVVESNGREILTLLRLSNP